jgi:hypothetical protein
MERKLQPMTSGYDQLAEKGYHLTQVAQRGAPGIPEKALAA